MSIRSLRRFVRRHLATVLVGVVAIAIAAVVIRGLPRPVAGFASLDQCLWGWPVVAFEGEAWRDAVPDGLGAVAPSTIPVASWPRGLRFDEGARALIDEAGAVVFRSGDRVRISGSMVRTSGDPAPCFYTVGVNVESITAP